MIVQKSGGVNHGALAQVAELLCGFILQHAMAFLEFKMWLNVPIRTIGFDEVLILALIDALTLSLHLLVCLEQVVLLFIEVLLLQDKLRNGHPVTKALVFLW